LKIPVFPHVYLTPKVDFLSDREYADLPEAIFNFYPVDTFPGIASWHWELGDGNYSAHEQTSHQYQEVGFYDITLTVVDTNGCKIVVEKPRYVEVGRSVFIIAPNAFSPNGDGVNDFFHINHRYIRTLEVQIFDRWGNMVYITDNPSFRWDGTLKGQPLPEGVFVFTAKGFAMDGTSVFTTGTITLIR